MPSDNNNIINRPFADLHERMAEVERLDRTDDITNRREVDYRAICNYLNSEIFHLISSVDDPQVKLGREKSSLNYMIWWEEISFNHELGGFCLPGITTCKPITKNQLPKRY